ncbi:hypothetical protein HOO54_04620 [Bacillus sp. WMMC1349]|uniref:ankyrin repeat domain-containing protein n=1 Tax=Bacillus sp. WMMC1349 TaxID=2736254 RepID=UPI0015517641|nr:ankyrin repeat domain-containing protein [Bacillus sp. WMMC1349]NPC91547.1 hypothetical protein [Bacillus sp. WMMC1349]
MDNKQVLKEIRTAIKQNHVERVVELIRSDIDRLNVMTPFGTWLHVAASHGKLEIVKHLINLGADMNKRGGVFDGGAINNAAWKGHIDIVRYLLSYGAELDVSDPARNPLFGAILNGHLNIVELLIESGIDIHVKYTGESMKQMDALAFAHEQGQTEIVELLASIKGEQDTNKQAKTNISETIHQDTKTEIVNYITRKFGPIHHTISEIIPGSRVAVDIQMILPSKECDFITLVTTGMSDVAMDASDETAGYRYAELVLKLPANWPTTKKEIQQIDHDWPLKWLRLVAHIPHQYDGWLDEGVILPNGEPPMPFGSNTELSCMLISDAKTKLIDSKFNRTINFYTLIPIYAEERELALQKGHDHLIETFNALGMTDVLDLKRKNIGMT